MMHFKSAFEMTMTVQLRTLSIAKEVTPRLQKYATRGFLAASRTVLVHRGLVARTLSAIGGSTLAARLQGVKMK